MTSLIDSSAIDELYPVAGADNDSQGFRDNFNVIKNNFTIAESEITDLQTNTAKLNATNNFGGQIIQNAVLQANSVEVYNLGNQSGSIEFSWLYGNVQTLVPNGVALFNLTNWPEVGKYGKMTVIIAGPATADTHSFTFIAVNGNFITEGSFAVEGSVTQGDNKVYEFWTITGGATVFARYLGNFT